MGQRQHRSGTGQQQLIDLYTAEFDAVYRFCLARCGDSTVAEDVTAETFFAAASAIASNVDEVLGRPWLFVVARRRLVDHWRRAERHRRRILRILELGEARDGTADELAPSDSEGAAVLRALQSLSPRQRTALALRYLDDYSVAEVAATMDVDYRAAESLLARGRRSFIKAWEEQ